MASITQFCAKIRDMAVGHVEVRRLTWEWAVPCMLALALAGCFAEPTDFGFRIERIEARAGSDAIDVVVHQQLVLSSEAKNALNHGVPLFIHTELELQPTGSGTIISQASREFEIRYLPLSSRYQVITHEPASVHAYPRLRHVLAELGAVRFSLQPGSLPPGEYLLRARSSLDKQNMPPPMRLPAWISAQWKLDSGWQSWPLALTSRQ